MKRWLLKFKDKKFVQRLLVHILGDIILLAMGLIVAYYLRISI
jgi:hypothetical protein